jgi:hypothetical protein
MLIEVRNKEHLSKPVGLKRELVSRLWRLEFAYFHIFY